MPNYRIEYGDPDRDEINCSAEDLYALKESPGWAAVQAHFQEILEHRQSKLLRRDISQRDADHTRGQIELCKAILGESDQHEPLLDMLIDLAQEQQEDGRRNRGQ